MEKLLLIVQREYLTRVKKRSFILATILTPLAFALFFIVVGFIFAYEGGDRQKIVIVDEGDILNGSIKDNDNLFFSFSNESVTDLKARYDENEYDGILFIPRIEEIASNKHTVYYYSRDQLGLEVALSIEQRISHGVRDYKIEALNLDKKQLESLDTRVVLDPEPINESDENASTLTSMIAAGIGGAMGVIMYMTVFIYGMMVMRGVMEEKMNRIVEVMISSVKPFQLMMGKIIGVGAVGLTQVAIWAILIPAMSILINLIFGFDTNSQMDVATAAAEIDMEDAQLAIGQVIEELYAQNWWLIVPLFIFYFLGGYFLYSSLFAAVGSAMGDDLGEGQALTIPITIPVILAFYIMFAAIKAPQSSLAVWSSIFPLFSPIVMPARLAFDPPAWQIILSILTLAFSSIFFVWLSARIYRVGILMYGKKVTLKELGKWLFYKA